MNRQVIGGTILVMIVVGIILSAFFGTSTEYISEVKTHTIVEEVTPDWAEDEDAVKAAQDVIRKKELEAELAQLESEVEERNARITEIEKELGTY